MAEVDPNREEANAARWSRAVTAVSTATALTLLGAKLVGWVLSGSVAVLGSLFDSGLDLVASLLAFAAVRFASVPADENHRFGHQKAEAVSALLQTALIAASATLVTVESIQRLIRPEPIEQAGAAIFALALSVAMTVALITLQTIAVRKTDSMVIRADRAHYTGDVISNGGVLVALVVATQFGIMRADAVAGLFAAAFLFWSVKEVAEAALPQLMDEELPEDERRQIERIIRADPGVSGLHNLRTRRAGSRRFIQVDLEMPGSLTLRDAHAIAVRVSASVKAKFPNADILVHQDAEDDDSGEIPAGTA